MSTSPGKKFWEALSAEKPLQIAGTINAYAAMMAEKIGFRAIYLSGAGVANYSYGLPDLGVTTLDNVLEDARRITSAVNLPLLVDIDTGWGNVLMIKRTIKGMLQAGVAAVHMEDQVFEKKCGHLPGKEIVPVEEMVDRLHATVEAKTDPHFVIMARTDAFASEGLEGVITRGNAYRNAGADMLFAEAIPNLNDYKIIREEVGIPVLANLTEFGKTPLYTLDELRNVNIDMALYPLSATRAMNKAAWQVFEKIRQQETQKECLDDMQTREELYEILHYKESEQKLTRK